MKEEIWKDIPGYEGLYQVSNQGNVISLHSGSKKILSPFVRKNGYTFASITKDKKKKTFSVHRLVALAFLPNPKNYPVVNHKDENPKNNNVDNLEWCTQKYNCNYGNGKWKCAEAHYKACACYQNGKLIKKYKSIKETEKDGFIPHAVCYVCKGNRPKHYGYEWRYI